MFKIAFLLIPMFLFSLDLQKLADESEAMANEYIDKQVDKTIGEYSANTQNDYRAYENEVKELNEEKNYILYFTSQSLDGKHQIALTREVARLNALHNSKVKVVPMLRGLDDGVFDYAKMLKDELDSLPPLQKLNTLAATEKLKLNPKFFKHFKIEKVPVMVTAKCTSGFNMESCTFYYLSRGETSIVKMTELSNVSYPELFKEKLYE